MRRGLCTAPWGSPVFKGQAGEVYLERMGRKVGGKSQGCRAMEATEAEGPRHKRAPETLRCKENRGGDLMTWSSGPWAGPRLPLRAG